MGEMKGVVRRISEKVMGNPSINREASPGTFLTLRQNPDWPNRRRGHVPQEPPHVSAPEMLLSASCHSATRVSKGNIAHSSTAALCASRPRRVEKLQILKAISDRGS